MTKGAFRIVHLCLPPVLIVPDRNLQICGPWLNSPLQEFPTLPSCCSEHREDGGTHRPRIVIRSFRPNPRATPQETELTLQTRDSLPATPFQPVFRSPPARWSSSRMLQTRR